MRIDSDFQWRNHVLRRMNVNLERNSPVVLLYSRDTITAQTDHITVTYVSSDDHKLWQKTATGSPV